MAARRSPAVVSRERKPTAKPYPARVRTVPVQRGNTVLLVEDNPDLRWMMQAVLEHAGFSVLTANDGNAAFRLCLESNGSIDVLITDIILPGINGVDLIELFHAQWPRTKAILLSGQIGPAMLKERQITVPFLTKPVVNHVLIQTVREALRQ